MKITAYGRTFEVDDKRVRGGVAETHKPRKPTSATATGDLVHARGRRGGLVDGTALSAIPAGSNPAPAPIFVPKQVWFMPGPLPGMNDYISTGNRFRYDTAKKKWHKLIAQQIQHNGLAPMSFVHFRFTWYEKNKRRDPDNFTAIGKKFILDALKQAGILTNDGWNNIAGLEDRWLVNAASPGVMIEMEEVSHEEAAG